MTQDVILANINTIVWILTGVLTSLAIVYTFWVKE